MSVAFRLFAVLVGISPVFLASEHLIFPGLLGICSAIIILLIVFFIPPGEAAFLSSLLRPIAIVAIVPAIWMVIQTLPTPIQSLRHPIWVSAEAALGKPILGNISVSPGDTLLALARYTLALGLFFIAAAVSIDRRRAEFMIFLLTAVTAILAVALVFHDLCGFLFLGVISSTGPRAAISAAAALGVILSASAIILAIERYETRHNRAEFNRHAFLVVVMMATVAFAVCSIAVVGFTSKPNIFAVSTGCATFFLIVVFRRLGLSPRMGLWLSAAALAVLTSTIASDLLATTPHITLRFSSTSAKEFLEISQRLATDTSWLGSGAGTFGALLPLYQDQSTLKATLTAPTTAAAWLIGLGAPALWIIITGSIVGISALLTGALKRGRDSFFAAAGGSCGIVLLIQVFADASLNEITVLVIAAAVLGLGAAQRVSRTSRAD
jgi:hypothetical protein